MIRLELNKELNGVELYFNEKPTQKILSTLKENSFRWSGSKKCWYAKQNIKTLDLAQKLSIGGMPEVSLTGPEQTEPEQTETKQNALSLWDATRWVQIDGINNKQGTKVIGKEIKHHVKSRFPQVKFSVTSDYNSIRFYIMSSPYEKDSIYLKAVEDYCTNLIKSYNYCTHYDPYGDYGSNYNFFGAYCQINYDYTQTDQTEEIKKGMINFDAKQAQFEEDEENRMKYEYEERLKQQEIDNIAYQERLKEEVKHIDLISKSITIKDLTDDQQYFINDCQFAHLNKNNTLQKYIEEVVSGKFSNENIKVNREIRFNNEDALNYFSNMLLNDFDFITGDSGSGTDDIRINTMTDYQQMTEDERKTVNWYRIGIAVYLNDQIQFVIDSSGYSYARYIGLIDNVNITKENPVKQLVNKKHIDVLADCAGMLSDYSTEIIAKLDILETWNNSEWDQYKNAMKDKIKTSSFRLTKEVIQQLPESLEELKIAMYKLLAVPDNNMDFMVSRK